MAEIENEELQPLEGLRSPVTVMRRAHKEARVRVGPRSPKRIRFGHRADMGSSGSETTRSTSELTHMHSSSTTGALSARRPSDRARRAPRRAAPCRWQASIRTEKACIGMAPRDGAREAVWQASPERPRRPGVRQIGGIGFVAAIGGIRHRAARRVKQAFNLVHCVVVSIWTPTLVTLMVSSTIFPLASPLIDAIRLARGESVEPLAALLARRGLYDRDAAHGLPARQRLADEEVDMRLQQPAGAELGIGNAVKTLDLDESIVTPVSGLVRIQMGKLPGASSSEPRWVTRARRSVPVPHDRFEHFGEVVLAFCGCPVARSRACGTGSAKQIVSRTTLTRT